MHRRWMSLPLLTTCASAFYPYHGTNDDTAVAQRRFVPYHPLAEGTQEGVVTIDIKKIPKRGNSFPVVTSNQVSAPNAMSVSQDGSDFSYFSTLKFGSKGQNMYMLIDSGSANTWVMGEGCASRSCAIHNLFGASDSTTLNVNTSSQWSLTYGTGQVSGTVASDTVSFANFTLSMGFGLATTASDDFVNYPMDGILGLGRTTSNELNTPTLMQVLATQGKLPANVYSVHLNRASDNTKDGEIMFGGVDTAKFSGSISYTKTSNAAAWEIPVDDAFVNGTACKLANKKAIVDTGTSYILMPPRDAQVLHSLIPGSSESGETFVVPCTATADVQISFNGVRYSISPKDYIGKASGSGNMCSSNIVGHQAFGADEWILGDVFLKNVYSVFDFDQAAIGFAMPGSGVNAGSTSSAASPTSSARSTTMATALSATGTGTASPTSTGAKTTSTSSDTSIGNPFDVNGGASSSSSRTSSGVGRLEISLLWTMLLAFMVGTVI